MRTLVQTRSTATNLQAHDQNPAIANADNPQEIRRHENQIYGGDSGACPAINRSSGRFATAPPKKVRKSCGFRNKLPLVSVINYQ